MKFNINNREKKVLSMFLFMMIFSFNICSFAFALTEEEKVLDVLDKYYSYSVEGDIDNYLSVQDPLFLEELSNDGEIDLKKFYEFTFSEVKTSDYSIEDAEVVLKEDSALVYYRLKGKYETKDGEKGSIDNDMVAFLWKYDDWKVRWTITRTLYEQKIAMTYIMDAVVETTLEDLNDEPIRAELIAEGFDIEIENYELEEEGSGSGFFLFILLIVMIIAFFYFKKNKGSNNVRKEKLKEGHHSSKHDESKKSKHKTKTGK